MAEIDILICHSEQDNEAHWVDNFKKFVELMLTQVLGKKPHVVLKPETEQITEADLKMCRVIIPVLSASFMESGECLDTLEAFIKNLDSKAQIKYQDRVFNHLCLDPNRGELAGTQQFFRIGKRGLNQHGPGGRIHFPIDEIEFAGVVIPGAIDQNEFKTCFYVLFSLGVHFR